MPVRHVLKVNGYGGRQAKGNEKSLCLKGWETLVYKRDDPLAELIQCILNSADRLVIDKIYILKNGKCTDFANDSGKQTVCYLSIVSYDQKLVCKL